MLEVKSCLKNHAFHSDLCIVKQASLHLQEQIWKSDKESSRFATSRPLDCSWINISLALVFGYTKLHCEVATDTLIELWSSTHLNSERCLSAILSSHSRPIDWRRNSTRDARSVGGDTAVGLDGDDMGGMASTPCDCHVLPPTQPLPIRPLILMPLLTLWRPPPFVRCRPPPWQRCHSNSHPWCHMGPVSLVGSGG
jgi:hypothetical protein